MFYLAKKTDEIKKKFEEQILYENEEYYYLPRLISKYSDSPSPMVLYTDKKFKPVKCKKFNFTYNLRENQTPIVSQLLADHKDTGNVNRIVHANAGLGKTIISIYMAQQLKTVTLVVVYNNKILEQLKERIFECTNLTEDDIGLIKANIFDVKNKTIILTTPQTLASKFKNNREEFYPKFREIGIDLILWDEFHQLGQKWAAGTLLFNTKNFIGLSATPYHTGDKKLLMHSIGGELVENESDYDYTPEFNFLKYDSGLDGKEGWKVNYLWDKNFHLARSTYNKLLLTNDKWLKLCVDTIEHELKDPNNRVMVIIFTKKQLEVLYKECSKRGLNPVRLFSGENDIDQETDRLLIATLKYAAEAFDYKALNRLLLAVPLLGRKSLIQAIGRILRRLEGKVNAKVFDLIDTSKVLQGRFSSSVAIKKRILNQEYADDIDFIEVER